MSSSSGSRSGTRRGRPRRPPVRALDAHAPDLRFRRRRDSPDPGPNTLSPRVSKSYLYMSLTNSIAFSPTDAMPLTLRAKAMMGFQFSDLGRHHPARRRTHGERPFVTCRRAATRDGSALAGVEGPFVLVRDVSPQVALLPSSSTSTSRIAS